MEAWQRYHIKSEMNDLKECTRLNAMLSAELQSKELLTVSEANQLSAVGENEGQDAMIEELYKIVMGKANSYNTLIKCLEACEQTGAVNKLQTPPTKIWFNVTDPSTTFFGRTKELNALNTFFNRPKEDSIYHNLTCIVGMGGIGKTELSRMFCRHHLKPINSMDVIWINSETDLSIRESFVDLARKLKIPTETNNGTDKSTKSLRNEIYLSLKDFNITFVLDNVPCPKFFFDADITKTAFEVMRNVHFVITSRIDGWDDAVGVKCTFPLHLMEYNDAVQWVLSSLPDTLEDIDSAKRLVEKLDRYTLAITQAVSYIAYRNRTSTYTLEDYLIDFSDMKKKLEIIQSNYFMSEDNKYEHSTLTTFTTSMEFMQREEFGKIAQEYLYICAYLNPDSIPASFFRQNNRPDEDIEQAFRLLMRFSLVKVNSEKNFTIHRVLQQVVRFYLIDYSGSPLNPFLCDHLCHKDKGLLKKLKESYVLEFALVQLNRMRQNEMQHATHVWKFVSNYTNLVKRFYQTSLYGRFQLSPLHLLSEEGDVKAVSALLKTLFDCFGDKTVIKFLNKEDGCGRTPVFLAAAAGYSGVVNILHNRNANLRLHCSVCYQVFEELVHFSYDMSRWTVMHIAVYNNRIEVVKQLQMLDPCLVDMKDTRGESPVMIAIRIGNDKVLEYMPHTLEDKIGVQITKASKTSNEWGEVLNLLRNDISQTRFSGGNYTLLDLALWANAPYEVLDALVIKGGNITDFVSKYFTVLTNHGKLENFKWLIRENLKVSGKLDAEIDWHFPNEAAKQGCLDIVKYIFPEHGKNQIPGLDIDINWQDDKGDTALYQAAYHGRMHIVKYLVTIGANVNSFNKWGCTPIMGGTLKAKFDVVNYLASHPYIEFLPRNLDTQQKTLIGMLNLTPLHAAVAFDNVEMTAKLLQIFHEKNICLISHLLCGSKDKGQFVISLLHAAAFFDCPKVLDMLLKRFSDEMIDESYLNIYDCVGSFYAASKNKTFNMPPTVTFGAKTALRIMEVYPRNYFNISAYTLADLVGNSKCAELLIQRKDPRPNKIVKLLLSVIKSTVTRYKEAMKDYLLIQTDNKSAIGSRVHSLVVETILGWHGR